MPKKRKSKNAMRDTKKAKTVPCDDKRTEKEKKEGEKFVKKIRETRKKAEGKPVPLFPDARLRDGCDFSLLDIPEGIDFSDFDLDFYRELVRVLFDQPYTCGNYRAYYARKGTNLNRTSIRSLTQISIRKTLKHLAPNRIDGKRICC